MTFSRMTLARTGNLSLYPVTDIYSPVTVDEKLYESPAISASYAYSVRASVTNSAKSLNEGVSIRL